MIMFWQKLKNNVKDEIIRDERDYESLTEFIEIVMNLNNKLYERVIKKRYDQFKNETEFIYKLTAEYVKTKQQLYIKNSKYTELASIKLNIIHWRKRKNFKNKKESKKKLCYECEKICHFVKNCHNENVMFQEQLNVTWNKIFETDDIKKVVNKTVI